MKERKKLSSWSSKYKPFYFNELSVHRSLKKKFFLISKKMVFPNLILSGPPGSGKTSGIFCLARKLFPRDFEKYVYTMNASDERGVEIIREKIKIFCKIGPSTHKPIKKLVILDEADSLTNVAQEALRRIMEIFSDKVRFALICNFPSKIIEPIQSRCAILRFKKINEIFIIKRLIFILNSEKIIFDNKALETVIFLGNGDIRQTLNVTQKIVENFGNLTSNSMKKFHSLSTSNYLNEFLLSILNNNLKIIQEYFISFIHKGTTIHELINLLFFSLKGVNKTHEKKFKAYYFLCKLKFLLINEINAPFKIILCLKYLGELA